MGAPEVVLGDAGRLGAFHHCQAISASGHSTVV